MMLFGDDSVPGALRDIAALVEGGTLVRNPEGGRSTSYSLASIPESTKNGGKRWHG